MGDGVSSLTKLATCSSNCITFATNSLIVMFELRLLSSAASTSPEIDRVSPDRKLRSMLSLFSLYSESLAGSPSVGKIVKRAASVLAGSRSSTKHHLIKLEEGI